MGNHPRYAAARQQGADPVKYAEALQAAGYATDPGYARKIAHILGSETFRNAVQGAAGPVLPGAVMANGAAAVPSARSSGVLSDV